MPLPYVLETVCYPHSEELNAIDIFTGASIGSTVLRPVLHGFPLTLRENTGSNLEDCLEAIDYYMISLASAIEAAPIEHRWVITDDTDARTKYGRFAPHGGLVLFGMEDKWLGAYVKVKRGVPCKTQAGVNGSEVIRAARTLNYRGGQLHKELGFTIREMLRPEQYLVSVLPDGRFTDPTLVDIDIVH